MGTVTNPTQQPPQPTPASANHIDAAELQHWLDTLDQTGATVSLSNDSVGLMTAAVRLLIRERDTYRLLYLECCTDVIGEPTP